MSNVLMAKQLQQLRTEVAGGHIAIEEAYRAFERLTYELVDLRPDDDPRLRELTNEIELIRFTQLPEDQAAAVGEVMERAQRVFDELAERSC